MTTGRAPARPRGAAAAGFWRDEPAAPRTEAVLSMTPMIDVVFLLIIFFMCSQFRTHEGELLARLPDRAGIVPGARVLDERNPAVARVYMARDGGGVRCFLNGAALPDVGRLYPALVALRQGRPDLEAIVDGDDALDFDHFLRAFDECLRAGITRVGLVRAASPAPED